MSDHPHHEQSAAMHRPFLWALVLNVGFVVVELIGGYWTGSLALLADAAHNTMDVLGLIIAWVALSLGRLPASLRYTYGLGRASILAAMANALLVLVAVGALAWEASQNLSSAKDVPAQAVLWIALAGIVVNGGSALLFIGGSHHDLNIRGAFLHMVSDTAVSAGVVASALAIMATGWLWLDPLAALAISLVIGWTAFKLFKDAFDLGMDRVPPEIDIHEVQAWLCNLPEVQSVHDLHIWPLSTTRTALTAHLVVPQSPSPDFLFNVSEGLNGKFNIAHVTIQVERSSGDDGGLVQCDTNCQEVGR
ncbi:MAG: cation diffusion facilitator family transporter [Rhodospirillales bacterium]|nr:cation diffusion facilitator family transporter [Rhodospirillales bacterium]